MYDVYMLFLYLIKLKENSIWHLGVQIKWSKNESPPFKDLRRSRVYMTHNSVYSIRCITAHNPYTIKSPLGVYCQKKLNIFDALEYRMNILSTYLVIIIFSPSLKVLSIEYNQYQVKTDFNYQLYVNGMPNLEAPTKYGAKDLN